MSSYNVSNVSHGFNFNDKFEAVVDRFWNVYNWIRVVEDTWPDFASTGFLTSYAMALLAFPFVLLITLYLVWSIAAVGPARKTLSSTLIILFAVPLYPVLTGLVLAILWIIMSFGALALAIAAPIFLVAFNVSQLWDYASDFAEEQREETPVVDDISFGGLLWGLIMGIFCMCTFGVLAFLLTMLKAPVVFLACIFHFIYHTLPPIFKHTGCWCPCAFLGWCFGFVAGVLVLVLSILVSALVKLVAAAIWPAYVSTGWLRYFGGGGRRNDRGCCAPIVEGLKAGYQVLWAADLLTNACIYGDLDLFRRTTDEFGEIATGRRAELSPECRKIACLPPVVVGLFQGSWDMTERAIAKQLGISTDAVREAWGSLRDQMTLAVNEGVTAGLLTKDYILEVPPELVIGLPARVLLDTVERSRGGEIVLANGLRIDASNRPSGGFADKVWEDLQAAIRARSSLQLTLEHRTHLCGALLAGGGEPSAMPYGLARAVADFEALPQPVHDQCAAVQRHLIAVALECSRQASFRKELENVIQSFDGKPQAGAAYRLVAGPGAATRRDRGRNRYGLDEEELSEDDVTETVLELANEDGEDTDDDDSDDVEENETSRRGCVVQ